MIVSRRQILIPRYMLFKLDIISNTSNTLRSLRSWQISLPIFFFHLITQSYTPPLPASAFHLPSPPSFCSTSPTETYKPARSSSYLRLGMTAGLSEVSESAKQKLNRGLQLAAPWGNVRFDHMRPQGKPTEIKLPISSRRLRCSEGLLSTFGLHSIKNYFGYG